VACMQGFSAESLLMLLQLWIVVLVGTEQEGGSGTMLMPLHAVCIDFFIPLAAE